MIGDDADRAPACVQEPRDAMDEAVELLVDPLRKLGRAEMVAMSVDLAGLQPAARAGGRTQLKGAVADDFVAALLHGVAQGGGCHGAAGAAENRPEIRAKVVAGNVSGDGGDGGLGGGGDGRDRGPPGLRGGDPAALLEAIGQTAAELVAETIDEDDAFTLGRGDGAGTRFRRSRRWKRVPPYSSLERLRRLVQPGRVEMADGRRDSGFVLGWGKGESFTRAPVGLPAALGVNPRDIVRGGPTDTLFGCRGEAGQRTKHLRERRASQPGPYPFAPEPVVLFELLNRPAGISSCEIRQLGERVVDGLLILLIQIRPSVTAFENEDATRPATPQHLRDPPELLGSLVEP